jgi:DNA-binding LacI/PurR family transcriptional regulator
LTFQGCSIHAGQPGSAGPPVDAVFAASDLMAAGALLAKVAGEAGGMHLVLDVELVPRGSA